MDQEVPEYEVEAILAHDIIDGRVKYERMLSCYGGNANHLFYISSTYIK